MDRARLPLLLGLAVVAIVLTVIVATRRGGDDGPPDDATAAAVTSTTAVTAEPTATVPSASATTTPDTTAASTTAAVAELAVGEHPICAAWDTFLAEGDGLSLDTPDDVRLDNERQLAFYRTAVELLDGVERDAAAGLLAYHEERAAFWPQWGWDFAAFDLEFFGDVDRPAIPWPTSESADGWRQTLTDRCGLEFLIEEGS